MRALPVVVGFGGYNAGGRSSFHQSYRRTIFESLGEQDAEKTVVGLACLMRLVEPEGDKFKTTDGEVVSAAQVSARYRQDVLDGTLIRRIGNEYFDPDHTDWNKDINVAAEDGALSFLTSRKQLPDVLPANWSVEELADRQVRVTISGEQAFLVPTERDFPVKAAGQLPSGFRPGDLYNSRFQPRGLQMAIVGATDAVKSIGIPWETILQSVPPDQMGVYASNVFGQVGEEGFGGLLGSRYRGGRPTSKSVPMSLNTMPADFLNAYVLGSLGHTEATTGACATFLYNLRSAVEDIKNGCRRVAFVGCSEAPVDADLMEGFANMSALATNDGLAKLDGVDKPDSRRASRPFGLNCGFTIGESTQYVVLMDDALAIELGADIHGAATDVFINADGIKKSISGPGAGNYVTFAKSLAATKAILGEESIRRRSMVSAHGSSTPQNRVTESHIFHVMAESFGMENWPVAAVKAFFGHTQSAASADQFVSALGTFRYGIIPGIKTIDAVADDVHGDHLLFPLKDHDVGAGNIDACFVNAKGFGGNNATGVALSPQIVEKMLAKRYGDAAWKNYLARREATREAASRYELDADRAELNPTYRFGDAMVDEQQIAVTTSAMTIPGYDNPISLDMENPYDDMA
ncbi:MAG: beta-ketoacyl synthase [bacterium]